MEHSISSASSSQTGYTIQAATIATDLQATL